MMRLLSLAGWMLAVLPLAPGPPARAQEIPIAEGSWDSRFGPAGTGSARTVAHDGTTVFAGTRNFQRWTGNRWETLNDFRLSWVNDLAFDADGAYVGGYYFQMAGGLQHIARWSRATGEWSTLGSGVNWTVKAIVAAPDGSLYVGGDFDTAGDVPATHVARWDPATRSWSALGDGLAMKPDRLAWAGDALFAAGDDPARGDSSFVARWDGVAWTEVGAAEGEIRALAVDAYGSLLAAGCFDWIGHAAGPGIEAPGLARLVGESWEAGPSGILGTQQCIADMAVANGLLHIAIVDESYAPGSYSGLARWSGSGWLSSGPQIPGNVARIVTNGTAVFFGGDVTRTPGAAVSGIGSWNPADGTWSTFLSDDAFGISGLSVRALGRAADGTVYAAGRFSAAGSATARSVARWTGSGWESVGGGLENSRDEVWSLAIVGDRLYIGGDFETVGGKAARNVAMWSIADQTWSAVGAGLQASVDEMVPYGTGVIAAAGNTVWRWENGSWSQFCRLDSGFVTSMGVAPDGSLVMSGYFTTVNSVPARNIARFRDGHWEAIADGIPRAGIVTFHGADLWVPLTLFGDRGQSELARWDEATQEWTIEDGGLTSWDSLCVVGAFAAAVMGDVLFVGGAMVGCQKGASNTTNIVRWDGTTWTSLGEGLNESVHALLVDGAQLMAAGRFTLADGMPSMLVGIWTDAKSISAEITPPAPPGFDLDIYPNPSSGRVLVSFSLETTTAVRIEVYDVAGRLVSVPVDGILPAGPHSPALDAGPWPPGIYWVRLRGAGAVSARPFAVVR